jgi:16S rRNA (cytosine967-C5)-methyltransferase
VTGGQPSDRPGAPACPPGQARQAALEALAYLDGGGGFLREELHALFERLSLPTRDRALATQLAAGAVRHRRTLRLVLSHLRGKAGRAAEIQPKLRRVLELGAFQLLFLDRVPAYAAINEAVEAARQASGGRQRERAAGFVNGMLRGLQRLIAGRQADGRPARDAIPHPEGGVVRLRANVLPDAKESFAAFLGAAYSYPDWLVARWLKELGEKAEEVCRWGNRRPHLFARANPLRHTPAELLETLRKESPEVAPGPRPGTLDVSALDPARLEALLAEGSLTVQDPSAMAPVEALAPAPGENVLDLCASPGTKTTQIVEAMGDRGRVVAADRTEEKLAPVRRTVAARSLAGVTVCLSADAAAAAPAGGFDAALVDAPCSNTGVLARRVEARWRLRPEELADLPRLQLVLLAQAAAAVRPGGRLVYSTCSLQREENGGVIETFLRDHAKWRAAGQALILPGPDHDGAFWARLESAEGGRRNAE